MGDWLPAAVFMVREPGAVGYDVAGRVFTVFELEVVGGVVQAIRAVVNSGKLGHIRPVSDVARLPEMELPQQDGDHDPVIKGECAQ